MDWSFLIVFGAMAVALGQPWLIWSIHVMLKGVRQTSADVKDSTSRLSASIDRQSQDLASSQQKLIERIQHLEAIVTSEAWDTMAREKQERIAESVLRLEDEDPTDADRAARLARSLDRE
jgi:uncharacterized protein YoaH (UPF0181 family)